MTNPTKPESSQPCEPAVENLVRHLFGPAGVPFLDVNAASADVVEAFVRDEAVLGAVNRFRESFRAMWEERRGRGTCEPSTGTPVPFPSPDEASSGSDPQPRSSRSPEVSSDAEARPRSNTAASLVPRGGARPAADLGAKPHFRVPNGNVGQPYAGRIEDLVPRPSALKIRAVTNAPELGISFSEGTEELLGVPAVPGEHLIAFEWSEQGRVWFNGTCILTVNADPKTLWKVVEPDASAMYPKPHVDSVHLCSPGLQIAAASRRGRSHEHTGAFRDDDFFVAHEDVSGWSVIIAADGAGSAPHSRWGSRLAVKTAGEHIVNCLAGDLGVRINLGLRAWEADPSVPGKEMGSEFHFLYHKAASLAVQAIEDEARVQGFLPKSFATTLLIAAVRRTESETFLATFWIGDGAIAAYGPRGKVRLMGAPDGGEFAGQTRFLDRAVISSQGFGRRIRVGRYSELLAVILMTDGVSDPRFETDDGLADGLRWDALWDEVAPSLASTKPDASLADWLQFFTPGHHDDRTIALLW